MLICRYKAIKLFFGWDVNDFRCHDGEKSKKDNLCEDIFYVKN